MLFIHNALKRINVYLPYTNSWIMLAASVPVALATGTLFVYSVYNTQLADKCNLDASQTANLNISATLGTALGGLLSGVITDKYGTQMPILFSCLTISLGYRWVYMLYMMPGAPYILIQLLVAMFLVGLGSVSGYFSCLKAIVLEFPNFRSSAQSVTIASFAISSLLYLTISSKLFKGDTGQFLYFLHVSCGLMLFVGFLFIRVEGHHDKIPLEETEPLLTAEETPTSITLRPSVTRLKALGIKETLESPIFWYHYAMFAIMQGLGQMYIYSVGYVLKAVHYAYSKDEDATSVPSLQNLQVLHVSLIAIFSFVGRLLSGPQSDYLVRVLRSQRHWIVILGTSLMLAGHLLNTMPLLQITHNLHKANIILLAVSCLIGYAYGFSFASFPAIVADLFNMKNYSFIWGVMYTSTTFGLTLMTKLFGAVYDWQSNDWDADLGKYVCAKGSGCYRLTFEITSGLCVLVIVLMLGYIRYSRAI